MKKLVSLLLAVCTCLSVGVMLTACGDEEHTHTYKTEWSKDTTHHWHACEGEDCTDVSDKAEHIWNGGEITTEATTEADGVKTFTCTVCGQTKTETVDYTVKSTVTAEEWETALNLYEYNNLEYIQTAEPLTDFLPNGIVRKENHNKVYIEYNSPDSTVKEYYVEENGSYYCYHLENDSWHKTEISKTDLEYSYMETIMLAPLFNFQDFEFDSISGYYKAEQTGNIDGFIIKNAVIKMADCKVVEIQFETNNIAVSITVNYDKTELNIPTVSESVVNTVTEEEWEDILIGDYLNNVTVNEQIVKRREGESEPYATTNNIWKHTEAAIYSADYEGDVFSNQHYYVKKDNVWYNLKEKTMLGISAGWQGEAMSNEQAESKTFAGDIGVEFVDLYSSFTYNSENKCYEVFEDEFYVKIYIEEGKLEKIEMNSVITSSAEGANGEVVNGTKIYEAITYTFSDYGTTKIENIPEWTVAS